MDVRAVLSIPVTHFFVLYGTVLDEKAAPPPGSTDCASRKGIIQDSACIRHVFEVDHHAFCPGKTVQIF